jgi:hypothetical protein
MLITDQVATAPCTDPIQDDFPTFEAKQPDAIITNAYAPILILGAIGGLVIGIIVGKWGT